MLVLFLPPPPEYRGHVFLTCSQSCSIAYHPTCWRRFKNESVVNSDRDFLLTSCPTPDCAGEVDSVSVFDLKGKCKIKVRAIQLLVMYL